MKKVILSLVAALVIILASVGAVNACHWPPQPPKPPKPTCSPTPTVTPTPTPDPTPDPSPSPSPLPQPPAPLLISQTDGAEFELVVCNWEDSWRRWEWAGGYWDGHVLADEVDQVGSINGQTLRVVIPQGTVINEGTSRAFLLFIGIVGNDALGYDLWIEPKLQNFTFSQEVVIYRLEGEEWVELVRFTRIERGEVK